MRDYRFRVWNGKRMIQLRPHNMIGDLVSGGENITWEVMQYTGLKDKNGKDYFLDDIAKHPNAEEPEHLGWVIEWLDFRYVLKSVFTDEYVEMDVDYMARMEIIGNKFETPELLEK